MDGRPPVSGASGQLGRLTAGLLVAAGADPILVTRTPEAVADLGCETPFGVTTSRTRCATPTPVPIACC
jgi:NAD(P)-dependent dehydrogenase (short-subunit alcohol dehydrogenase family)